MTQVRNALLQLEAARTEYAPGSARKVEKLLSSFRGATFGDAESLAHFHDSLLFLRAFPQSRKIVQLTEALLGTMGMQAKRLIDSGADTDLFDSEQFSGIAGTAVRDTFTYEVARWLTSRFPQ